MANKRAARDEKVCNWVDTEEKFEQAKKFRYDLTINNAHDFINEHRKLKLKWEPIGAIQGWDVKSYANAAKKYGAMGYKYIALGGMVRATTTEVLKTVEATVNWLFDLRLRLLHSQLFFC